MKKIIALLLSLSFLFLTVGCSQFNSNNSDNTQPEQNTSKENTTSVETTGTPQNALDSETIAAYLSGLDTYVLSDRSDASLKELHQSSQDIEVFPIFQTGMEETDLVFYLFNKDNEILGGRVLTVEEIENTEGEIVYVSTPPEIINGTHIITPLSDEDCTGRVRACRNTNPDFKIVALMFNIVGYQMVFPLGYYQDETVIKLWANEPTEFLHVEPFSTLEDGVRAYENYRQARERIIAELPIYLWKSEDLWDPYRSNNGFINAYLRDGLCEEDTQWTSDQKDLMYDCYFYSDNKIIVPLVNPDLGEGRYLLHLLYYHNELIGEFVIQKIPKSGPQNAYICHWYNLAEKDADGNYIPITEIKYQQVVKAAQEANPDHEICGVIFENGKFVPYYLDGDTVVRCPN